MARVPIGPVLRDVERLFATGSAAGLSDAELLGRFASRRDEAAFASLVHRHGPMVLGVCRRLLRDPHDADDAFQATFLILARRAGAIRRPELLGNWLYGVARRVASRARSQTARRHCREVAIDAGGEGASSLEATSGPADWLDLRGVIDEELARLPESQRRPIVLCHLEGLTHEEAAARLNWPVGTVRSRMARGRERLRSRLVSRGMAPATLAGAATLSWSQVSPAAVPDALVETTVRAAMLFAATSQAAAVGTLSIGAVALARGFLNTMLISKLKVAAAIGLTAVGLAGGGAVIAQQAGQGGETSASGSAKSLKASLAVLAAEQPKHGRRPLSHVQLTAEIESIRQELSVLEARRDVLNNQIEEQRERLADRLKWIENFRNALDPSEFTASAPVAEPTQPSPPPTFLGAVVQPRVLQGHVLNYDLPNRLVFQPDSPDLMPNPGDEVIVYQPQWETMTLMNGPGRPAAAVRRPNHVVLARARVERIESGKALCSITEVYNTKEDLRRGLRVVRASDLATVRQEGVLVPDLGSIPATDSPMEPSANEILRPAQADPFEREFQDVTRRLSDLEQVIENLRPRASSPTPSLFQGNATGVGGSGMIGMASGGGLFGGGSPSGSGIGQGGLARGDARMGQPPYIQSDQVIVVQPEGLDAVHAYSVLRGSWSTQPLPEEQSGTRVTPIVGGPLAAFTAGKHVFAFSAMVGQWDGIKLDAENVQPMLGGRTVIVEHGGKLHVFSAETGTWSTKDVSKRTQAEGIERSNKSDDLPAVSSSSPSDEPSS